MDVVQEVPSPAAANAPLADAMTAAADATTSVNPVADAPAGIAEQQQQQQQAPPAAAADSQQAKAVPGVSAEARAICDLAAELLKGSPGTPGYSILMKSLESGDATVASALVRDLVARPTKSARAPESEAAPTANVVSASTGRGSHPPAGFASGRTLQPAQQQAPQQQQQLQPFGAATGMVVVASANRPRATEVEKARKRAPLIFADWNPYSRNNVELQSMRVEQIVREGMEFARSQGATVGIVASTKDVSKVKEQIPAGKTGFVYQSLVDGSLPTDVTELVWQNIDAFAAEVPEGAREYQISVMGRARINEAGKRERESVF